MDHLGYDVVKYAFSIIGSIFFKEIRTSGVHGVPESDPCLFIVGPHANQFLDPGMVMISNPRRFAPIMAEASFKRKFIGACARLMKAIPVTRPQDLASDMTCTLKVKGDDRSSLIGEQTRFKQQVRPRDQIALSKAISVEVQDVISDQEIKLKSPLSDEALQLLQTTTKFKVIPHVDQGSLFDKVHEHLAKGESIVIFPEGGSHDRSEMLPLKAGFAIMALGAMAEHKDLNVKIVPVGLNYFHPHKFRSRAVVSYGAPITIPPEVLEQFKQGGPSKRAAISSVLKMGKDGLESVTVNAPNYDTLMIIAAARRLYTPTSKHKLSIDQVVELNRRFLQGHKHFEKDPRLIELSKKVQAYNNALKYFGLRDHQVERTKTSIFSAAPVLTVRLLKLACLVLVGFPSVLINSPIALLALSISRKKQKEALAASSVKIAARDVVSTWKVLVALVFAPILYGFYSVLVYTFLRTYTRHALRCSVWLWVAQPLIQYAGLRLVESGSEILGSLRPLILAIGNPDGASLLREMRSNLAEHITLFVQENGPVALEDFDPHKYDYMKSDSDSQESGESAYSFELV